MSELELRLAKQMGANENAMFYDPKMQSRLRVELMNELNGLTSY